MNKSGGNRNKKRKKCSWRELVKQFSVVMEMTHLLQVPNSSSLRMMAPLSVFFKLCNACILRLASKMLVFSLRSSTDKYYLILVLYEYTIKMDYNIFECSVQTFFSKCDFFAVSTIQILLLLF